MNDVQQIIRGLRAQGWTLVAISQALNLSESTVRKWSAGARYPANAPLARQNLEKLSKKTPANGHHPRLAPPGEKAQLLQELPPALEVNTLEEFIQKYDPEKAREGLRQSAGAWKGLDTERIKREIYEARE